MDYTLIKATLAAGTYAGADDVATAANMQAATIAGPNVDVAVGAVVGYLGLQGKLTGLQAYVKAGTGNTTALTAATELLTLLSTPSVTVFAMSNPVTYAAVKGFLDALVADSGSGITAADEAALLAMAATTVPFARTVGETITADILARARLLP